MGGGRLVIFPYVYIIESSLKENIMKLVDRVGQKFGKLLVLEQAGRNELKKVLWKCKCECENEINVAAGSLVTGNTTSCGCVIPNFKHGGTGKGSFNTWKAMIRRCTKTHDKDYPRYGGAGVTVCTRWLNYINFSSDMGEPNGDETLDRINVYGNYEPTNCRWAGIKVQNRNVKIRANSKTGVIGVSITHTGKYMAKVTVGKKAYYSKCFNIIEEAAAARKELEAKYWSTN
jgi:hypothetical protein